MRVISKNIFGKNFFFKIFTLFRRVFFLITKGGQNLSSETGKNVSFMGEKESYFQVKTSLVKADVLCYFLCC